MGFPLMGCNDPVQALEQITTVFFCTVFTVVTESSPGHWSGGL